ncbi:MAG: AmmeMemoRadiSam system radical SAM enzyme [Anaerolineae bacterium]|nr:AmmeMemoRadiSam system radical SAM enzyme [Anaerolineae bacterium]
MKVSLEVKALLQEAVNDKVRCLTCERRCELADGQVGWCRTRENRAGTLYTLIYGAVSSLSCNPIEKKPLYHFLPGTPSYSIATPGCNFRCPFCQNWQISQSRPEQVQTQHVPPGRIVDQASSLHAPSIAYTYGEPVVFIEYMTDIASLARERGIRNVVVSSGYINRKPLLDLCARVDAIKIDLKAFDESYYRDVCSSELRPVLDAITTVREQGVWLEIVYLMVPTLNDDPAKIREMARWLRKNVGAGVPVHFSRFFPQYRMKNLPPTPVSSLERAYDICREEGLQFVYVGNVPRHEMESTYCPSCDKVIIHRQGYRVLSLDIVDGQCRFCGAPVPGMWQEG